MTARRRRPRGLIAAPALASLGLLLLTGCGSRPAGERAASDAASPPEGLGYAPPEPGTYELPPIQPAADGTVLDTGGGRQRLFDYLGDRYVVLSFVYTRCVDARGCPLATNVLRQVHSGLADRPGLAGRVRLVTLSFDPERDSPVVMQHYAEARGIDTGNETAWAFLAAASAEELAPILDGYGQSIVPELDLEGRPTGRFRHVLKVFLIDPERRVRNIYSTNFLHPAVVISDIETLRLEEG